MEFIEDATIVDISHVIPVLHLKPYLTEAHTLIGYHITWVVTKKTALKNPWKSLYLILIIYTIWKSVNVSWKQRSFSILRMERKLT